MRRENEGQNETLPIDFGGLAALLRSLAAPLTVASILGLLFLAAIAILAIGWLLADLISGDQKRAAEATKAALPILAAAIGLPLLIWRLRILDRQTRISEEKTQIDREAHYTSIFSRSIDQLGQTRELKSSEKISDVIETLTRTVPNIEVRLGGIHSLARLAEESRRDRSKIESTLRSYVRENSWLARNGENQPQAPTNSDPSHSWQHDYQSGTVSADGAKSYEKWKTAVDQNRGNINGWSASITDARVDVNEAIDAVTSIDIELPKQREGSRKFFECLFVGRQFTDQLLTQAAFERCTFLRCKFNSSSPFVIDLLECTIVDSYFALFAAKITLSQCKLINGFVSLEDSILTLDRNIAIDIGFDQTGDSSVKSRGGYIRDMWFASDQFKIESLNTRFSRCNFESMNFSSGSEFKRCVFPECSFEDADITEVTFSSMKALSLASANERTRLSDATERPTNWPPLLLDQK